MTRMGEIRICSLIRVVILSAIFLPFPNGDTENGGGPPLSPHHPFGGDDRDQTNIAYGRLFCKWGLVDLLK
jgi:hypothetical protein